MEYVQRIVDTWGPVSTGENVPQPQRSNMEYLEETVKIRYKETDTLLCCVTMGSFHAK